MTVTADDPRAEILAAIVNANESAKRMHDSPAYWAVCHQRIDEWLYQLEALGL